MKCPGASPNTASSPDLGVDLMHDVMALRDILCNVLSLACKAFVMHFLGTGGLKPPAGAITHRSTSKTLW